MAELERRLGVPVALDNDVRVAVIAEGAAGAGRGCRDWIALWPGTGIGGGVVIDGEVVTGVNNSAGELGHITVKAGGPKCGCGGRGHLEALASRTAIVRWIEKRVEKGDKTSLTRKVGKDVGEARSDDLREAFDAGDKLVTRAIERGAKYLAIGIASVANAVNPELVVLGGGLIEAMGEPFVRLVEKNLRKHTLKAATADLRVVASQLGDDAGITGAALIARRLAARRPDADRGAETAPPSAATRRASPGEGEARGRKGEVSASARPRVPASGARGGAVVSLAPARLTFDEETALERVLETSSWQLAHVRQVQRIAAWLFEVLRPHHGLGDVEERLLLAGALLHDVGYPTDPPTTTRPRPA